MSRGNARQQIFIDTGDDTHFLGRLAITTAIQGPSASERIEI